MSVCLSVVSHRQAHLGKLFLGDLDRVSGVDSLVLTQNVPDEPMVPPAGLPVHSIVNARPKGFAANHNQAFAHCESPFFCVANPDLRLQSDPFPALLRQMEDPAIGVIAPMVLSPAGTQEDNARYFPTLFNLGKKMMGKGDGRYHLAPGGPQPVEWAAGMFLLFRTEAFRQIGGFDEKFHLYYEDVDICVRLWNAGWKVMVDPGVTVVHHAQRASRHDPGYMAWHASSMVRYFFKHLGRLPHAKVAHSGRSGA